MVVSWFREMYRVVGIRLVMKAYIIVVFTWFGYDCFVFSSCQFIFVLLGVGNSDTETV